MIADTLYAEYIKERDGAEVLESTSGFITFKVNGDECFIHNMFVKPEFRKSGAGRGLVDILCEVARDHRCKAVTGNIHLSDKGANNTLLAALLMGFEVVRADLGILLIARKLEVENG